MIPGSYLTQKVVSFPKMMAQLLLIAYSFLLFPDMVWAQQGTAPPYDNQWLEKEFKAKARNIHLEGKTLYLCDFSVKAWSKFIGPGTITKKANCNSALKIATNNVEIDRINFNQENTPDSRGGEDNCDIKLMPGSADISIRNNRFQQTRHGYSAVCGVAVPYYTKETQQQRAMDILISGNRFLGYVRPLMLDSMENIRVTNNSFKNSQNDAIRTRSNSGHVIISNNQFENIGYSQNGTADAIDTHWSGEKLIITGNNINRTGSNGLDIKNFSPTKSPDKKKEHPDYLFEISPSNPEEAGLTGSRNIIISNNQIRATLANAIHLGGLSTQPGDTGADGKQEAYFGHPNHSILITSNILEGNNRSCIYGNAAIKLFPSAIRYVTISDNSVINNCGYGIYINGVYGDTRHLVKSVRISGNMIINNGFWCESHNPASSQKDKNIQFAPAIELDPNFKQPEIILEDLTSQHTFLCDDEKTKLDFGIVVYGVDGAIITENTVGNDPLIYNPMSPEGIFRTYHDIGIYASHLGDHHKMIIHDNVLFCSTSGANISTAHNASTAKISIKDNQILTAEPCP
ncbi:MAG: hypothetical protein ACWA5L_08195 [bacterium]